MKFYAFINVAIESTTIGIPHLYNNNTRICTLVCNDKDYLSKGGSSELLEIYVNLFVHMAILTLVLPLCS